MLLAWIYYAIRSPIDPCMAEPEAQGCQSKKLEAAEQEGAKATEPLRTDGLTEGPS